MPVLIENKSEEDDTYPTLFGFTTKNGFASKSLNFVYIIIMVVAVAFAYHALSLILTGWSSGLIFLASLAVVGLPYCVKIVMYGKEVFEYKMAVLCILISLLPTIFDFVGFYSETSIKQSLSTKKFEVLEIVNYFDKEARKSITKKIENNEREYNNLITKNQQDFNSKTRELNDKVNKSKQVYIDETEGVKGKITSGNAGVGPKAKELEADMRKITADVELDKKTLTENNNKDIEKIKKDYEIKEESLKKGIEAINGLLGEDGLVFKVNKAENFIQLADVSVKLNSAINVVSSKLDVEPKYIKFESENVIQLSFGALLRGDITAMICFLLAVLLEIVDTIIVYMVRGVKPEKKKKYEDPIDNLRSRTYYY
jgi:hypothetical protein